MQFKINDKNIQKGTGDVIKISNLFKGKVTVEYDAQTSNDIESHDKKVHSIKSLLIVRNFGLLFFVKNHNNFSARWHSTK